MIDPDPERSRSASDLMRGGNCNGSEFKMDAGK